jgi:hypothetical protein
MKPDTFKSLLLLASIPFLLIYGTWAWAVTFVSIWGWFIVPTFHFDPLSFKQAIAVSAVVGLFFIKGTLSTKKTEKLPDGTIDWSKIPEAYTIAIVAPWITWLIYWVIKAIFI